MDSTGQLSHSCIPTGTHGERQDGVGRDLWHKPIQGPLNSGKRHCHLSLFLSLHRPVPLSSSICCPTKTQRERNGASQSCVAPKVEHITYAQTVQDTTFEEPYAQWEHGHHWHLVVVFNRVTARHPLPKKWQFTHRPGTDLQRCSFIHCKLQWQIFVMIH